MIIFNPIKIKLRILLYINMMLLSSCSLFSPVKMEAESNYILNTIPHPVKTQQKHPITLFVSLPETVPAYNTTQMAYTIKPYQIAYFIKNRWAETPSQMLHPLIVQTLQNTGYFHAIVTPPFIGNYDYVLNIQILQLQQNFTYHPAKLQLTWRVQINKIATGKVIATKLFSVRETIPQKSPYGGVIAANRATEKLLAQLVEFCLQKIH
ncbi:MAG: hypothetical protein A3F11_11965 [Gammaproteobacteria bacterium RIFCSPHIGHO2_12_FULL_37_14]|nr:MAG: hypothetical protein A3F11_11965 [Gammaproteobacteria bacterium RIFCSPHIGHO2_12_FULL_37_14]